MSKNTDKLPGKNETICPIHVIYGKDRRRIMERLEAVVEATLEGSDPQLALHRFDGAEAELGEVLDALRTLPFLSPRRVVVVKDADTFIRANRGELETYLEKPAASGILILTADSFPENTRLAKRAKQIGQVYKSAPVGVKELPGYLEAYAAREYQLRLDREATALLIELGGDDANALSSEIDKLATYLGGSDKTEGRISVNLVEELVGNNRQYSAFNVIDAMMEGEAGTALAQLDKMFSQDRSAQYKAVGAFAWHFRRLYLGRVLVEQRVSEQEIFKQARVWWSQRKAFMKQVRRLSLPQAGRILTELMEIDLASKTGGGTVRTGLEKFIVRFCQDRMEVA